jgi:hypothetical protein
VELPALIFLLSALVAARPLGSQEQLAVLREPNLLLRMVPLTMLRLPEAAEALRTEVELEQEERRVLA